VCVCALTAGLVLERVVVSVDIAHSHTQAKTQAKLKGVEAELSSWLTKFDKEVDREVSASSVLARQ
jgi:hypothetical protein